MLSPRHAHQFRSFCLHLILVFGVVFGPTSGALVAMTAVENCGHDCPCSDASDESALEQPGSDTTHDVTAEDCGPDCSDCDCSPGLAMAVVPPTTHLPSRLPPEGQTMDLPPTPATGPPSSIFKPPRSIR